MTAHMIEHAVIASGLAPALVLITRPAVRVRPLAAWVVFIAMLWALNLPSLVDWLMMRPVARIAADVLMLGVALLFWLPVLGRHRALRGLGAGAYLLTASMASDLIWAWYMAMGETAAGLAMVSGMLPMGVAAVWLTWSGLRDEERRALRWETFADATR
jgi:cytochrome c oxidase assembly factor CtaG